MTSYNVTLKHKAGFHWKQHAANYGLTLIPARMYNYINDKVKDEITDPMNK